MPHGLLHLITTRPELLADHAQAYAELAAADIDQASAAWKRQVRLAAVALCSLCVAAVLAGVALMLWAVVPAAQIHAPWALWLVPLLPVVLAAGCFALARAAGGARPFLNLKQQLHADLAMLRGVGAVT